MLEKLEKFEAWKRAMDLAVKIRDLTKSFSVVPCPLSLSFIRSIQTLHA